MARWLQPSVWCRSALIEAESESQLTQGGMQFLYLAVWRIWYRRNRFLHNSESLLLDDVLSWAIAYGKEYMSANEPEVKREGSNIHKIEKWVPPPPGGFKVNTDAALDAQAGHIGVGIIRNDVGDVMASSAQKVLVGFLVPVAGAVAILKGMQFACESGLNPSIFESDAQGVVNIINSRVPPLSEIGMVIYDILRLLDGPLTFAVAFVSRTANSTAHGLAKLGLKVVNNLYLMEEYPPGLVSTVMGDRPQFFSPCSF
ncbi:hypothetical protein Ddye_007764 [Dipteronia dyeriana]|uniref:RNase H type-1 domain-containing protein n=1 Tax=Dipteronia dyeriana TaxID=168575 RepID=A0AAD9XKF4_9ROSI|nr:hypothetical protein Ddye_007764 [Dipteronia dyeriana]